MNPDSLVGKIYKQTGIGQQNLAFYAGAKQSTLSRYEDGTRSLPTEALLQLAALYKMTNNFPLVDAPKPTKEEKAKMLESAAWCRMQCYPLQKELTAMQLCYQQAQNMFKVLNNYAVVNNPLTPKQQRWVEEQRYQTEKKLAKNGWLPQQELIMKLSLLNHEAVFYEDAAKQI